MDALQSAFAVVVVVVALAPGMIYGLVRITLRGFRADDRSLDSRIAQALMVSLILDAIYLVVFNGWIFSNLITIGKTSIVVHNSVTLGGLLISLGVVIPAAFAVLLNLLVPKAWSHLSPKLSAWLSLPYRDVPASWDWVFTRTEPSLIRIQLPDGRWFGGWYGPGSYVSTYPESRDIYLSHQYDINQDDGTLGKEVANTSGLWLTVPDGAIVEFIRPSALITKEVQ